MSSAGCTGFLLSLTIVASAELPGQDILHIRPGASEQELIGLASRVVPHQRQLAWQKRELMAFVHFGMNTFTDREWGDGTEDPAVFNPSDLDARQWAETLRESGVRLVILTAKHHDGFCLWPSAYTDHSVRRSPWKEGAGDVVEEVARASRAAGLAFGIYLSPWDRHEPSYGDSPRYNRFFLNQLRELLTRYGEIAEVWFDGACGEGANGMRQVYDWPAYYATVRELQPEAVIAIMGPDVRWVGTESGYARETEWSVLPLPAGQEDISTFTPRDLTGKDLGSRDPIRNAHALFWYPAEADVSIRPGWFYHQREDSLVKSADQLVDIYYGSVGRNACLLLNVPADRRGRICEVDAASLKGMRDILHRTFSVNLAARARVSGSDTLSAHPPGAILDSLLETYWTTAEPEGTAWLEIQMDEPIAFDRALLQEAIQTGQRVEGFRLEAWSDRRWVVIARGTTIGYKRLERFGVVHTDRVRVVIEQSRSAPAIATFGLFRAPAGRDD